MKMNLSKSYVPVLLCALISVPALGQQIKTRIATPQAVAGIAANPVTNLIYVVEPSFGGANDTLAVIDGNTDKIVNTITVPTGAYLPAVNYLTNRIYIASCNNYIDPVVCFVTVVDGAKNKVIANIPVTSTQGIGLTGIAVNPVNSKLYLANASDNVVNVVSTLSNKLLTKIAINGETPADVTVNPYNGRLYVPFGNNQVGIIDTNRSKLISTATVGNANNVAAVDIISGDVFVSDNVFGPSTVGVLDANGNVLATVPVGDTPYGIDVNPITNRAFSASTALDSVTVINGATFQPIKTIANVSANFIAVNLSTGKTYLAGNNGVVVLTAK